MSDPHEQHFENEKVIIRLRKTWCKNCMVCVEFCPTEALTVVGDRLNINVDACKSCMLCELRCPDFAISVERKTSAKPASGKNADPAGNEE